MCFMCENFRLQRFVLDLTKTGPGKITLRSFGYLKTFPEWLLPAKRSKEKQE